MVDWYKIASEYTGWADSQMSAGDINSTREIKQGPTGTEQGLSGYSAKGLGIEDNRQELYGIMVDKCGQESHSRGGCGRGLFEYGQWLNYSVTIGDKEYRAYKCHHCKHQLKPYDIFFTNNPKFKKKKPKRKRVRRLSHNLTLRNYKVANSSLGGTYNNPANAPYGRQDLTDDLRAIPWDKYEDKYDQEYDGREQADNKKKKIIKVKKKDGSFAFVSITVNDTTGGDGVSPSNSQKIKGRIKKQPRYNPADGKDKNDGHGAWPHNRDGNKGWYQSPQNNNLDTDFRQRVVPWDEYIRERGTNMLTLTKPY
jgi:hypothetical protein